MPTDKVPTGIRFDEKTLYKMKRIAERERRSFNAQMEYLADNCIREYEKQEGVIPFQPGQE